jgi:hypothetical protein
VASKFILNSHFKVFEVNHSRHSTMHKVMPLGTKPNLFQVVIALKCSKISAGLDCILLSSSREVKHTFLYPQTPSVYLIGNDCHGNGWVKNNTV